MFAIRKENHFIFFLANEELSNKRRFENVKTKSLTKLWIEWRELLRIECTSVYFGMNLTTVALSIGFKMHRMNLDGRFSAVLNISNPKAIPTVSNAVWLMQNLCSFYAERWERETLKEWSIIIAIAKVKCLNSRDFFCVQDDALSSVYTLHEYASLVWVIKSRFKMVLEMSHDESVNIVQANLGF